MFVKSMPVHPALQIHIVHMHIRTILQIRSMEALLKQCKQLSVIIWTLRFDQILAFWFDSSVQVS